MTDERVPTYDELVAENERLRRHVEAVRALADGWEQRGKHDIAYADTIPDEDVADAVRDGGANWIDFARKVRAALSSAAADRTIENVNLYAISLDAEPSVFPGAGIRFIAADTP